MIIDDSNDASKVWCAKNLDRIKEDHELAFIFNDVVLTFFSRSSSR